MPPLEALSLFSLLDMQILRHDIMLYLADFDFYFRGLKGRRFTLTLMKKRERCAAHYVLFRVRIL